MQFVADVEATEDGSLQIMYGIDGRRDLTESTRDELSGYAGARPVRIGNGAFDQRQNDLFGAALDSILLHTRHSQRLPRRLWPIVKTQAECATRVWREPDQGIWEARGKPQHYVSSKLMCWVALDRASQLAEIRGDPELQETRRATADEIKEDILAHGLTDKGVLRQHYGTDALDASTLLAAILGFLPGEDERLRASVNAIADELTEDGFVLRYRTGETDDGMSAKERDVPDLLVLARLSARDRRRAAAGTRPYGAAAADRLAAGPVRRGVRRGDRPSPGQLPPGLLAPRADRSGGANHRPRAAEGVLSHGLVRRDHHRHRRRRRHACAAPGPSGKRILLLERGDWLSRENRRTGPRTTSSSTTATCRRTPGTTQKGRSFQPQIHYFVGGATKLYGAALYRLRKEDFGELRHHDGISPAWPIAYDELEP
jgi:Glycosyl hydrolases family 15